MTGVRSTTRRIQDARSEAPISSRAARAAVITKCVANWDGNSFHEGPGSSARATRSGAVRWDGSNVCPNMAMPQPLGLPIASSFAVNPSAASKAHSSPLAAPSPQCSALVIEPTLAKTAPDRDAAMLTAAVVRSGSNPRNCAHASADASGPTIPGGCSVSLPGSN